MSKLSKSELQRTLDSLAKANARAQNLRAKIAEHCEAVWGCDPADVDFDQFIDTVDGGCGQASSMSVDDFIAGMDERAGVEAEGNGKNG